MPRQRAEDADFARLLNARCREEDLVLAVAPSPRPAIVANVLEINIDQGRMEWEDRLQLVQERHSRKLRCGGLLRGAC